MWTQKPGTQMGLSFDSLKDYSNGVYYNFVIEMISQEPRVFYFKGSSNQK
jgi:hypothetical protein